MGYVRKAVGFLAGLAGSRVPHQPAENFEDFMHLLEFFWSTLLELCVELLGSMKYVGKALESLQVNLAWNPLAGSRVAASKLGRPARKF